MRIDPKDYAEDKGLVEDLSYVLQNLCKAKKAASIAEKRILNDVALSFLSTYIGFLEDGTREFPEWIGSHDARTTDVVNHPSHYTDGKYETMDFIYNWSFDWGPANTVKYISRAGKKHSTNGGYLEDLRKARYYLNDYVARIVIH